MATGLKLRVWGDFACFTRPEMKVERVSYDVMTPSAARGVVEAIHWKPAIRWVIDRIHVLAPIQFHTFRRNEVGSKISARVAATAMKAGSLEGLQTLVEDDRQQRATVALAKVAYGIEAHFEMTEAAGPEDSPAKHHAIATRRAQRGQCFQRPYLGCREFAADFELVEAFEPSPLEGEKDLGWMLYDIDHQQERRAFFFRARLRQGVLDLTDLAPEDLAA
ncbi:MAG: type I-C CRISPR-associated protein Cas5c [Pseudomonadota bacterium]